MIPLYTKKEFELTKSRELLKLKCEWCKKIFLRKKHRLQQYYSNISKGIKPIVCFDYCGRKCHDLSQQTGKTHSCKNCNSNVYRSPSNIRKGQKFIFCSRSCSATYWNQHKTTGVRRSKLEIWLENKLKKLYPNLEMYYNKTEAIEAELDIYIPSFKLAFELNGIFHYEPVFGKNKLIEHQTNDNRKFQKCLKKGIELCVINTTSQRKFSETSSEAFLTIIQNKMAGRVGAAPTKQSFGDFAAS